MKLLKIQAGRSFGEAQAKTSTEGSNPSASAFLHKVPPAFSSINSPMAGVILISDCEHWLPKSSRIKNKRTGKRLINTADQWCNQSDELGGQYRCHFP